MPTASAHYILHALSPLHFGTGVALGAVDLPISREANTGLPNAPGSGVKGVVKDALRGEYGSPHDVTAFKHALGAEPGDQDAERAQGAISFGDGLVLAFPVRSLCGVFAWVTSPYAIHRLRRSLRGCPPAPSVHTGHVATGSHSRLASQQGRVYFHDLELTVEQAQLSTTATLANALAQLIFPDHLDEANVAAERDNFAGRFAVVSDEDLVHLSTVGCEVRVRNSLELESKRVRDGALWSEEYAPVETLFWGPLLVDHINGQSGDGTLAKFRQSFGSERILQFGGKATVGKGLARLVLGAPERAGRPQGGPPSKAGIGERVVYPR